jgi:hypothetical protein
MNVALGERHSTPTLDTATDHAGATPPAPVLGSALCGAPCVGRRACAALAAASAVAHATMAAHHGAMAIPAMVMATICLVCGWELWTAPKTRTWLVVATMNIAMIALHLPAMSGHHHGRIVSVVPQGHLDTIMVVATGISAVEVVLAAAVLNHATRRRARELIPRIVEDPQSPSSWPGR